MRAQAVRDDHVVHEHNDLLQPAAGSVAHPAGATAQPGSRRGCAAGIGYRYGVDPVMIRVAFVVATIFGGAGIVLYLAAWLLFPDARNMTSPADSLFGRGGSPPRRPRRSCSSSRSSSR